MDHICAFSIPGDSVGFHGDPRGFFRGSQEKHMNTCSYVILKYIFHKNYLC